MMIETRNPLVTTRTVLERDMISPDLLADTVRTVAEDLLLGTPGALNWETFTVRLEERPQPATAPSRTTYMNLVCTAELL